MKTIYLLISLLGLFSCDLAANQTANGEKTIIVDVRTPEEWQNDGHADCSVNYPIDQFAEKIPELKSYKKVILVCRSGNRAGRAQLMLEEAGYKNVQNLGAWQNVECEQTPSENKP